MMEQKVDMTEGEAQAWAARLTRIWAPETYELEEETTPKDRWFYSAETEVDPYFESPFWLEVFFRDMGTLGTRLRIKPDWSYKLYNHRLLFVCRDRRNCRFEVDGVWETNFSGQEPEQIRINHWVSTFRRGCWLSGCDIEASAHEKMEWTQDFSREELEAWNLKF